MCASAAYYIAVAADQIYVDKASLVGSIGVLMDGFGFVGIMDKLGIERRLMTAGENKGMLDPFSPRNTRQDGFAQSMLDQIHQQFIQVVRSGQGKRLKETPETFSACSGTAKKPWSWGVADGLGSLDQVARDIVKAEDIVDYTLKRTWPSVWPSVLVLRLAQGLFRPLAHPCRFTGRGWLFGNLDIVHPSMRRRAASLTG